LFTVKTQACQNCDFCF